MDKNTAIIDYDDLDEDLKNQVREHFRSDPFLIPDYWYEDILENIIVEYGSIDMNKSDIEFDLDRNTFKIEGSVYLDEPEIEQLISSKYSVYVDEKEWLSPVNDTFYNNEMNRGYEIDDDVILVDIEEEIFLNIEIYFNEEKANINISDFKSQFENALTKYKDGDKKAVEILTHWLTLMDTSENIFFQDTIEITEDEYSDMLYGLVSSISTDIKNYIENEFYEKLDEFVSKIYDEIVNNLKKTYEYYFEDDYADESLQDKQFEVLIDNEQNQIDVIDLDGQWV